MFCVKCGNKLKDGICPNCGAADKAAAPTAPPQQQETQRPPQQQPVEQQQPPQQQPPQQMQQPTQPPQGYYGAPVYQNTEQGPGGYEPQGRRGKPPKQKRYKEKKPGDKKKKRTLAIILSSVAFLLVAGGLLTGYFLIDEKYNQAIDDLKRERPKAALESFEQIKWFKESDEYIIECSMLISYNEAVDAYDDEDYDEALPIFEELGDYEDSEDYAQLSRNYVDYAEANGLFEAESYEEAKTIFVSLGEFEDSVNMTEICQNNIDYMQAKAYYDDEDYEAANELFAKIPDFEDSSDMLFICDCMIRYNNALDFIDSKNYSEATEILEEVEKDISGNSLDFTDILSMEELKYNLGQSYFGEELFYSAYKAFKDADGYQDADTMSGKCIQTVKTDELYINPKYTKNDVEVTYYGPDSNTSNIFVEVYQSGALVSTLLIKHDETLVVEFPTGTYTFKIYEGNEWFGPKEKFGSNVADDTFADTFKANYYYWIEF